MTREEEIDNEAKRNFFLTKEEEIAFLIGAEWADRTMIGKACEWLRKNAQFYWGASKNKMIDDFKQAMMEENKD